MLSSEGLLEDELKRFRTLTSESQNPSIPESFKIPESQNPGIPNSQNFQNLRVSEALNSK